MKDFVHLHLHSEYSLLDGACRIKELVSAVKDLGQNAVAITDHGVMYGVIDFYKEAKKQGIKPIIGCEVYVAKRTMHDKVHGIDNLYSHLVLLCENETGYKNLIKLVSMSFANGFYVKPRIDRELLEKHHEGLIALSACLAGEIPKQLLLGDIDGACETALWYQNTFGKNNFFIEIQNHGLEEQKIILPRLINLSRRTGIPLVATNDVHYIKKDDALMQKVLICIQTGKTVNDPQGLEFGSNEFYLKSSDEMYDVFADITEACENTAEIARRCNVEIEFGKTKLPHFDVDGDHFEYLKELCEAGLKRRYGDDCSNQIRERLAYELDVINRMGYVDYYLIVYDFINFAKTNGIPVGPGRGSGAGSLAAYCIGITEIDPIKFGLIFERFLNPERVSMPDFDVDFCYVRREEVIKYIVDKYGSDHVAQIVTFGTLAAKAAVRDVGRALDMGYSEVDAVAKKIPTKHGITLDEALEISSELKLLYDSGGKVKELIDMARKVEGMPRHASTHAAGVVITRDAVDEYVPLARSDNAMVTQYTMTSLEELGLLKIDLLGLRTLTVIDDAVNMIRKNDPNFCIENIDLSDEKVFALLASGQTDGLFQLESNGMKNVLSRLRPHSLEDIIAVISLYRPGPVDSIPQYIKNRHNPADIRYKTPLLKPILDVTYGCLVYQEQVMQVFRTLAGYSFGRADVVRRAMAKKKHDVMEKERTTFVDGCAENGISSEVSNELFDDMTSFASYAFNKSHAAAYAVVAYRTAYLKCHYPAEFMAALLSSVLDDSGKVAKYISECQRMSVKVLPPNINSSEKNFTVKDRKVVFGLLAIKNLGVGFIESILKSRAADGAFGNFVDFCRRMKGRELNRRSLESLIKSGALDCLDGNRASKLLSVEPLLSLISSDSRNNIEGQLGLFDDEKNAGEYFVMPSVPELSEQELLSMERETIGIYISGHPVQKYVDKIKDLGITEIENLSQEDPSVDGRSVCILGVIIAAKTRTTKNNLQMSYITIEDMTGSIEILVFPKVFAQYSGGIQEGKTVVVNGRVSFRDERGVQIICEKISPVERYYGANGVTPEYNGKAEKPSNATKRSKYAGLHLLIPSKDGNIMKKVEAILGIFDGPTPVYLKFSDTGQRVMAPRSLWVELNEPMIRELKNRLGESNVCIIE